MALDSDFHRNLRDSSWKRGLNVPKRQNVLIYNLLYNVAQDYLLWSENDPERPFNPHKSAIKLVNHECSCALLRR